MKFEDVVKILLLINMVIYLAFCFVKLSYIETALLDYRPCRVYNQEWDCSVTDGGQVVLPPEQCEEK